METLTIIFTAAFGLHAAAQAVCQLTPTPKDDKFVGKVYKWIEVAAGLVGQAKQKPEDPSEFAGIVKGIGKLFGK